MRSEGDTFKKFYKVIQSDEYKDNVSKVANIIIDNVNGQNHVDNNETLDYAIDLTEFFTTDLKAAIYRGIVNDMHEKLLK
ncbi:hypothetical protein [Metabacillus sp. Hm71]|uniref:hypothetical protein n=1 Tax=Metabacillus sp. Hm71 TaxID=3450743 RepID=UPI003F41FEA3